MNFLLDTNVISELIKKNPDPKVKLWLEQLPEEYLNISVLSLGEIQLGIKKISEGGRKNELILWLDQLIKAFQHQTFPIDTDTALIWGRLSAENQQRGCSLPVKDGLIAATAYKYGAILVTRNVKDFNSLPIQVLNPWL